VIIPCYNQALYINECIDSLFNQTHKNWEALIVNDGSTDNSMYLAEALAQKDSRIHLINKRNGGLSSARNAGILAASGDFYQFLDADDLLFPEKLEYSLDIINSTGSDIMATSYTYGETVSFVPPFKMNVPLSLGSSFDVYALAADWETRCSIPAHCFLFARHIFRDIFFDESLDNHEDWDCWMRLFYKKPKFVISERVLAFYRMRSGSMSRDISSMKYGFLAAIDKHILAEEIVPGLQPLLRVKREEIRLTYWRSQLRPAILLKFLRPIRAFFKFFKTHFSRS